MPRSDSALKLLQEMREVKLSGIKTQSEKNHHDVGYILGTTTMISKKTKISEEFAVLYHIESEVDIEYQTYPTICD